MKKLLILLSIFFLLGNSNIKPADDAVAQAKKKRRIELEEKADSESRDEKESKQEAAQLGKSPSFSVKDDKVMKEIASAYLHIPRGISGLILDYCKTKFEPAYGFHGHDGTIHSLITFDGTYFASASRDGTIKIWQYIRSTADAPEKYICIQALKQSNGDETDIVYSLIKLDATHFASGSKDGIIKIWELIPATSSTPLQCRCIKTLDEGNDGHRDSVTSLIKLDVDPTHFISGSSDNTIKIWEFNPRTASVPPKCIQTLDDNNDGHTNWVQTLTKLNETHFVSGFGDGTIKIWELIPDITPIQYRCIHTLDKHHGRYISSLMQLDETHFVSGFGDGTIKIWKFVPCKEPICIINLDTKNLGLKLLMKLDERHFASGSIDKTIKIWKFIPATASTLAACICIQTLNIDQISKLLTRMSNGDLIAGLENGKMQVLKPVVDIE